jgi:hypothetical protein
MPDEKVGVDGTSTDVADGHRLQPVETTSTDDVAPEIIGMSIILTLTPETYY